MNTINYLTTLFFFLLISCSESSNESVGYNSIQESSNNWRVSASLITGGSPFNLVETPTFENVEELLNTIGDYEKLLMIKFGNEIRVYPYIYVNYSEVVNDLINDKNFAISYCPQTKSGLCFNRFVSGEKINFIASGFLYKDNQVMSNVDLNLFWSQMLIEGIRGDFSFNDMETFFAIETNWKMVKQFFPNAKVYVNDNVSISGAVINSSVNSKYFGVIDNRVDKEVRLFSYDDFETFKAIEENINGKRTIIIGEKEKNYIVPFYIPNGLTFSIVEEFPVVLIDNNGTKWDVFGNAIEGPAIGEKLGSPTFFVAELWAWKYFYENLILY